MTGPEDPRLRSIVEDALSVSDVASAVIFVVTPGSTDLELAAVAGVDGPALDRLVAAVRNPAHPVARALLDAGPSFDVQPMAPGGPALRSHLPLRPGGGGQTVAGGVLAVAHESPMDEAGRRQLLALADRAAAALRS